MKVGGSRNSRTPRCIFSDPWSFIDEFSIGFIHARSFLVVAQLIADLYAMHGGSANIAMGVGIGLMLQSRRASDQNHVSSIVAFSSEVKC